MLLKITINPNNPLALELPVEACHSTGLRAGSRSKDIRQQAGSCDGKAENGQSVINLIRTIFRSGGVVRSVIFCLVLTPPAYANGDIFMPCVQKYSGDDAERLQCLDRLMASASEFPPVARENIVTAENSVVSAPAAATLMRGTARSYLTKEWNLDGLNNRDFSQLKRIQPYRQTYLLVKGTSSPNRQPSSPAIGNSTLAPFDIDAIEAKFQFSFKGDISNQQHLDFSGIKTFRLWGAYTQQSDWQVFNSRNSYPLRETVIEPELIATLGTGQTSGLKLINLGLVNQSNGRSRPESRSWYRIYLLGGWEWDDTTSVQVRGWERIPVRSSEDDNPDISNYLGCADVFLHWEPSDQKQSVAVLLRNNLSTTDNRGYVQIDWATPVELGNALHLHIQMTSGYGESLIDYNHFQNTLGLGVSFREW